MYKKILLIILMIMLILISGCSKFGPTDKDKGELIGPNDVQIHKGFNALQMEFVKGQPPSDIWENSDFPITIRVKNDGATDINRGLLSINGNLYFSTDRDIQFNLEGKSEFNPEGEFSFEKFSASTINIDSDRTDSFFVVGCYEYTTTASTTICINPNIFDEGRIKDGECEMGVHSFGSGQGAPVTVTQVEEQIIPIGDVLRMNIKIHVSNKGNGKVIDKRSYMKECVGTALSPEDYSVVNLDSLRFSSYSLGENNQYRIICSNIKDNKFKLNIDSSFIIDCYADLDPEFIGSSSFTTPLITELSYGYSQLSEQKSIVIKNTPTN